MAKPQFLINYSEDVTRDCERVLVTLFSGLGPWRNSVFLVGGLTLRYLVTARPPDVPAHAGTGDIDVVVDLAVLADIEAYRTLEENLKRMGFERAENEKGIKVNWRWKAKTEHGVTVILEFLADDPKLKGGALQELPTEGNVSAVNIPHASLVFDLHDRMEVTADLLGQKGRATESIPYANIVSFTSLKHLRSIIVAKAKTHMISSTVSNMVMVVWMAPSRNSGKLWRASTAKPSMRPSRFC
ncbi:hypothetical protein QBK99_25230 [Corticibacterium sp. UT-5YL-CI-8]|nr:hypothetical protein [Tianweitania sp. UT-5YL-CI-8]